MRNFLYDHQIFKSTSYDFPVICIGNLNVGGTGKSPMTEYVIRLLKDDYQLATLSRGYGRSTKGYLDVTTYTSAQEVGDEPLQFATKFPDVMVAVCEDRRAGIAQLQSKEVRPEVIILDDAYQHRKVKAGFYVLLTAYDALYCDDFVLPAGNLREPRGGAKRADVIVVTKCPSTLSRKRKQHIMNKLKPTREQEVFFAHIAYDTNIYDAEGSFVLSETLGDISFTLVTGIANPKPLVDYLEKEGLHFKHRKYTDHHNFNSKEIIALNKERIILTTEKDYMRLKSHLRTTVYYLPIKTVLDRPDTFMEKLTACL